MEREGDLEEAGIRGPPGASQKGQRSREQVRDSLLPARDSGGLGFSLIALEALWPESP